MKKLSKPDNKTEFHADNCYVRFASVTPGNPGHYMAVPGNDKWENVRYVLERGVGCFKFALPMSVKQNSYLCATYQYSVTGVLAGTAVTSKTQVYAGDILTVTRHPFPKHLHPYVPPKYWSDLGDMPSTQAPADENNIPNTQKENEEESAAPTTEEEKLERLLEGHRGGLEGHRGLEGHQGPQDTRRTVFLPPIVVRLLKQHIQHPTDYATLTTPHPLFVCQYCDAQGKHFHTLCPYTETDARNNTTELLTKVRRIVGIPKSRLRAATPEEVASGNYYLNETNERVVVLQTKEDVPVAEAPLKKKRALEKPKEEPPRTVLDAQDLWAMRDMEAYEAEYRFSFEDYVTELDRLEQQKEDEFYKSHPELKKKKNQICTHYFRGMCHKGKLECEFLHSGDENYMAICQFFVNGQCTDAHCIYRHPDTKSNNQECNAYKRGFCFKGRACRYKHVKFVKPSDNPELTPKIRARMEAVLQ